MPKRSSYLQSRLRIYEIKYCLRFPCIGIHTQHAFGRSLQLRLPISTVYSCHNLYRFKLNSIAIAEVILIILSKLTLGDNIVKSSYSSQLYLLVAYLSFS